MRNGVCTGHPQVPHPPICPHLGVTHCLDPAAAQLPTGLEGVGGHSTAQLIQIDEEEGACGKGLLAVSKNLLVGPLTPSALTWVSELSTNNSVHQQGLPDHLGALSLLEGLGDEEEVGEEEAVDVHLGVRVVPWVPVSAVSEGGWAAAGAETPLSPAVLTLLSLPSRILRLPSRRSCRVSSGDVPGMGAVRSSRRNSLSSCQKPPVSVWGAWGTTA